MIIIRHFFVVVILSYLDLDIHCEHFSFEEQCLISSIISVIPPGYDYHAGHWIKIKLICKFEKDEIKDWISSIQNTRVPSSVCTYIFFIFQPGYVYLYRREGDTDYISTLLKELDGYLLVVITGEEKGGAGQLVVAGTGDLPSIIGKK